MPAGLLTRYLAPAAGGTTAGLAGTLAATHAPGLLVVAAVLAAGALVTTSLAKAIESIYKRQAEIIRAKGEKKARIITAKSEAAALAARTQVRTELLRAGLDPAKAEQAAEMLRLQSIDATLPDGPRLTSAELAKLLTPPKPPTIRRQPPRGPRNLAAVPDD